MRVNELLQKKKTFSDLTEWKKAIKNSGCKDKQDAYDENVIHAIDSRGHTVGYFYLNESFGEFSK